MNRNYYKVVPDNDFWTETVDDFWLSKIFRKSIDNSQNVTRFKIHEGPRLQAS